MEHRDLMEADGLPHLKGSRDPLTGQVYFPQRTYAADGSLRPCEAITLSRSGILVTWTRLGKACFGQIDLPEKVRVQTPLDDGEHQSGARYVLETIQDESGDVNWRFKREQ